MLKKNFCLILGTALLLSACGGGGGSGTSNSKDNQSKNGIYDLAQYEFNDRNKVQYEKIYHFIPGGFPSQELITYHISYFNPNNKNRLTSVQASHKVDETTYKAVLDSGNYLNVTITDILEDKLVSWNSSNIDSREKYNFIGKRNLYPFLKSSHLSRDINNENIKYTDKRFVKEGDLIGSYLVRDVENYTITCYLDKHYDSINIKDEIEKFFKGKYTTNFNKTYNDVLRRKCVSDKSDYLNYSYDAKDMGQILNLNRESSIFNGERLSSEGYFYSTKIELFDK